MLFEDPVRLMLSAGAHVSAGRVKLSEVALARSSELPLFGAMALKPGEDVLADVLRVAMLAAIAGLDPAPRPDRRVRRFVSRITKTRQPVTECGRQLIAAIAEATAALPNGMAWAGDRFPTSGRRLLAKAAHELRERVWLARKVRKASIPVQ